MHIEDRLRGLLGQERTRLAVALTVALIWFGIIMGTEPWISGLVKFLWGAPAVLVFVWWRTKPGAALGLSALTLVMVVLGGWTGAVIAAAAILSCATALLAVFGATISDDQRLRWAAAAMVGADALLVLGAGGFFGFAVVLLLGAIPLLGGWAWRQRGDKRFLSARLTESTVRGEAAEQDVLLELERNRLAREVHDVVAHSLAVVIAQADGARFAAESKPESVAPALEAISDTARRALGEVRTMLHDLRTSGEGGAVPGADDLVGLIEGVRGLGVEVDEAVYGEPCPLGRQPGLALYRVAQEALTNAMRHGDRVEPVGFEVDWGQREVVLIVTNAVPEDAVPASERAGHGVTGMRERAADAGGDCTAGVGSNGRFRVRVALPVAVHEALPQPVAAEPSPLLALLGLGEAGARG